MFRRKLLTAVLALTLITVQTTYGAYAGATDRDAVITSVLDDPEEGNVPVENSDEDAEDPAESDSEDTYDAEDDAIIGVKADNESKEEGEITVGSESETSDVTGVDATNSTVKTGDIQVRAANDEDTYNEAIGVSASGSEVTTGSVTVTGGNATTGVQASEGSIVTVHGDVNVNDGISNADIDEGTYLHWINEYGVNVKKESKITVDGDINVISSKSGISGYGIGTTNGTEILVKGDVNVSGAGGEGLDIEVNPENSTGRIEVTGTITGSTGICMTAKNNNYGDESAVPIIVTHAVEGDINSGYQIPIYIDGKTEDSGEDFKTVMEKGSRLLAEHIYYSVDINQDDQDSINLTTYTPVTDSLGRKAYRKDTNVNIKVESSKNLTTTAGRITKNSDGSYTLTIPEGGNVNLSLEDIIKAIAEDQDSDGHDDDNSTSSYVSTDGSVITKMSDTVGIKTLQEVKTLSDGSQLTATIYNPITSIFQKEIAPLTVHFLKTSASGKENFTMTATGEDSTKIAIYAGSLVTDKLNKLAQSIRNNAAATNAQKEVASNVYANVMNETTPAGFIDSGLAYYVNTDIAPMTKGAVSAKLTIKIPGKKKIAVTVIPTNGSAPYVVILNSSNHFTFDCPNDVYLRIGL